ncbi:hypothetical protein [Pleurocapsa sp. PCC 7319]|uniref:hypothetical protein n=1 Tax=Pleurocapsa sp. PCC 7319 TaxID=118161 RepID=UPI000377067F|nr:hypothetical protein [Pleurocapsa sp. PCC 7319]
MTFYLSGAGAYCVFLLCRMFSDQECSKTDRASWMVIAIASVFWVIVIPLSIIELQSKTKVKAQLDSLAKPMNFGPEARQIKTVQQIEEVTENITPQLNPSNF